MDKVRLWKRHLRDDVVIAFPRDVTLTRTKLLDKGQYLTSCSLANKNRLELFTSVYSDYEVENSIASTLFYDIDVDHVLKNGKSLTVYDFVADSKPLLDQVRTVYSGRRGVHIYVDINPVRVGDLSRAAEYVAELLGIKDYVDRQAMGDWRRMSRVPFSYHSATGDECVVITPTTNTKLAEEITHILASKFGSVSKSFSVKIDDRIKDTLYVNGTPPPCVLYLFGRRDLPHQARLHLGSYLLQLGLTPEEAVVIFAPMEDFKPETTLYYLRWLDERKYHMYSCEKARALGLCPLNCQHCEYYPTPNNFFR
jgi:hypothetical protein